jgi:acyl carrier protein
MHWKLDWLCKKKYGIKLKADAEETRHHFQSINTLAALIESQPK